MEGVIEATSLGWSDKAIGAVSDRAVALVRSGEAAPWEALESVLLILSGPCPEHLQEDSAAGG